MRVLFLFVSLIFVSGFSLSAPVSASSAHNTRNIRYGDYGLALRGNGELQAAHWGALARVIEDHGLPTSQAGGSSATITMFYLDSMLDNEQALEGFSEQEKAERVSFLFKSLEGFTGALAQTEQAKTLKNYYDLLSKNGASIQQQLLNVVDSKVPGEYLDNAQMAIQTLSQLGLFPKSSYQKMAFALADPTPEKLQAAQFEAQELINSIKVFGQFNAQTDHNLFFRQGIVDFATLARQFAKVAMFYAQFKSSSAHAFASWMDLCSKNSKSKTWRQILTQHPGCQPALQRLMDSYYKGLDEKAVDEFLSRSVGANIDTLVTTAVVTGKSVAQVRQLFSEYDKTKSSSFGKDFKLQNREDLRFGYWGNEDILIRAQATYDRRLNLDAKESRFLSLGEASWGTVLSISPAEPGLSPLKAFEGPRGEKYYSAGGWSDLHPTQVLKAIGAHEVIYVTREGGESLFAQGIAKRLLGLNKSWTSITADKEGVAPESSYFDVKDMKSLWSQLFNLGNLDSAYSRAVTGAHFVYLTRWNDFNIKQGVSPMIDQAYNGYYLNRHSLTKPVRVANPKLVCIELLRK